jgi:ELWxxDGT repeat protein
MRHLHSHRQSKIRYEILEARQLLAAQLVHDFNTNPADGLPPLSTLSKVGGEVYLVTNSGGNVGWRTDGTAEGTVPALHSPSASLGDTLLFFENGELLSGSDPDGSLIPLATGAATFSDFFGHGDAVWQDHFYFRGYSSGEGYELWKTDGTPGGTSRVKDIRPGTSNSDIRTPTPAGNYLFFLANDGVSTEVWRTDGSEAGTVRVTDFPNTTTAGDPSNLTAVGDTVYFLADDGVDAQALWKVVGNGAPEKIKGPSVDAGSLTAVGTTLFFTAPSARTKSQTDNHDLWKTDGTTVGTELVKTFPNNTGAYWTTFLGSEFLAVENTLYFVAYDEVNGYELWRSDGSTAGTEVLSETLPGGAINLVGEPRELTRVGDEVFFVNSASELWKSDGTPEGTVLVKTCDQLGVTESFPQDLVALGGNLLFIGYDFDMGLEPFVSNGTLAGTHVLKDTVPGTTSSRPDKLTVVGDKLFLNADDYVVDLDSNDTNNHLWVTDGSTVTSLPGGITASAALGNELVFSTPFQSSKLGKSDGTVPGTEIYADAYATRLLSVGNQVFGSGFNLYVTDGTTDGTHILGNGVFNTTGGMTSLGDLLIFTASNGSTGTELWRSDGTEAGTFQLKDIFAGNKSGLNGAFSAAVLGDYLYFTATDATSNYELWRTDGTPEGTTLFDDIYPGSSSFPSKLVSDGSTLYFAAASPGAGTELWKSDGTEAGTGMLKDLKPGSGSSSVDNLTLVGNTLFFTARTTSAGPQELWKSDGTPEGTVQISSGIWGNTLSNFIAIGNRLVFLADDGIHGKELWQSDGTAAGTVMISDIFPGSRSSSPENLVQFRGAVYFTADDGFHGRELWMADPTPPIIKEIVSVAPNPRSNSVESVEVTFSKPIDLTTFNYADVELTRNGVTVPIDNTVAIEEVSGATYRITGLGAFTSLGGHYQLSIDGSGIQDDLGQPGGGVLSEAWTTDTTNLGGQPTFVEDSPAVLIAIGATLNDDPALNFANVSLTLSVSGTSAQDELRIASDTTITTGGGSVYSSGVAIGTYSGGKGGEPLAIHFNASATRTLVETVLRRVSFRNSSQSPTAGLRTLNVVVKSDSDVTLIAASKFILVKPVNDAPVLDATVHPTLDAIAEDPTSNPGTPVWKLLGGVADVDSGAGRGLAITYLANPADGTWQYTLDAGKSWLALGGVSAAAARLLPADGNNSRIRFQSHANFNGTVRIGYFAWDQTQGTPGAQVDIHAASTHGGTTAFSVNYRSSTLTITPVNDAPVLDNTLSPTLGSITEDAKGPAGTAVWSLLSGAVTDVDASAKRGIAVYAASPFNGVWQFKLNGASWQSMPAVSDSAALLLPSDALVRFIPKADFNGTVKLYYRAWDQSEGIVGQTFALSGHVGGIHAVSVATENAPLIVTEVNDKPVLSLGGTIGYVHDKPAITLAPYATVTDIDSPDFAGGRLRVRITDGADSSNRLILGSGFTVDASSNVLQGTAIIGKRVSNGFGTNELVITFNANATKSVVQQLVRAITFKTIGGSAGVRSVVFTVSDGDGGLSAEASKLINVT